MTTAIRTFGFMFALAVTMPLEAQNRQAIQLTLLSAELAEGDPLRVSVKAPGLSGQRVVLVEGATMVAAGDLNLLGEAELVVRNLAPGHRRIMARLPRRPGLRSDFVDVQVTGEELPQRTAADFWIAASGDQGRRHVQVVEGRLVVDQHKLEIDGALAAAAMDSNLDGRMDLIVATRKELLLLAARLDGTYEEAVKLVRWPESIQEITNLLPGDWNGDGRWDVLLGTNTAVELWVAGRESLLERKFRETAYRLPVEADLNGDGMPDVLVERIASGSKTESWVWMGTGTGRFVPVKRQQADARPADAVIVSSVNESIGNPAVAASGEEPRSAGSSSLGVISAGMDHSLKLRTDGKIWVWGRNGDGQLGIGNAVENHLPVKVNLMTGVVAVAGGGYHSLALKSDGTVWAWGLSNSGQIGDGTATQHLTPVQVSGLTGVVAIAGGFEHSVALKSDGTVWAWGRNQVGQLGDGTTTQRLTPVLVSGLTGGGGVAAISAGGYNTLAVKVDGTVWAWGQNIYGEIGDGSTTDRWTPIKVTGLAGVVGVASGFFHSLALTSGGTVFGWGQNYYGALGDTTTTDRPIPVLTSGITGVAAIAAGQFHSLAVKSDGTAWGWGRNDSGQLGNGSTTPVPGAPQRSARLTPC